jgi:hypothetical protein
MVASWYILSEKLSPIGKLNRTTYFISITKLEGHLIGKVVWWADEMETVGEYVSYLYV